MESNIIEPAILDYAINGVSTTTNEVSDINIGIDIISHGDNFPIVVNNESNFQFSTLNSNALNSSFLSNSVYLTPVRRHIGYNDLNQKHSNYIFNSEQLKRPFFKEKTYLVDPDPSKRIKQGYYDARVDNLISKVSKLEVCVSTLTNENSMLRQEVIELNAKLNENVTLFKNQIQLIDNNKSNHIEMNDNNMPVQSNQNLYSSLFKIDDNKKITDPIHNIINIVNNNVEEKKNVN
jgi:hypothetical protein